MTVGQMSQCRHFCSGWSFGMEYFLNQVLLTLSIYWESKPIASGYKQKKELQRCVMEQICGDAWMEEYVPQFLCGKIGQVVCIIAITTRQSICVMMQSIRLKVRQELSELMTVEDRETKLGFSSDVDCSLKHEVRFVRMDNQIPQNLKPDRLQAVGSSPIDALWSRREL